MQQNVQAKGDRSPTIPAPPVHAHPDVARFLAAQAAVHAAIEAQRSAIQALRALDSSHPAVAL